MLKTEQDSLNAYQDNVNILTVEIRELAKRIDRFSLLRVAMLVLEILFIVGLASSTNTLLTFLWITLLFVPIVWFAFIVRKQNALSANINFKKNLLWVYSNEINLLNGQANGYLDGSIYEDEQHPYISDLDIFGKSSLYAKINRCVTKLGMAELASWFLHPSTKAEILNRQAAVAEIAADVAQTFLFRAHLKGADVDKIEGIKRKLSEDLNSQLQFVKGKFIRVYAKCIPYFIVALFFVALVFGGKLWSLFGLFTFVNATITYACGKYINQVYYAFSGGSTVLNGYAEAIAWTEQRKWTSPALSNLFSSDEKVSDSIKSLAKIIVAFDARLNFLLYAVLNFFFLWDIRCSIKLANWMAKENKNVVEGLERISYFEAFTALATLTHNHPTWTFPTIEDTFCLNAVGVGHPLIVTEKSVVNNYAVASTATVDIVTGSNMAGKSTFLRTLGVNMVLAYAGAPVYANYLQLSIFKLVTYMRIKDNLIENTSTFKAELNRLKMILECVTTTEDTFVLIDEMLRGTNSKDKFDGSKAFIEKLISLNTPSLFATHDLQLSELEQKHKHAVRNFHFDIQHLAGEMQFDYKMKLGPCTQFNAAILLKEIGLTIG